jgi:kinesin family protein 5
VPYRDSALTLLLKESLGGNSKTTLIVNCSMDAYNASESLNTMRFGQRAKRIENKPKINMEQTVGELKQQLEAVQHEYRSVNDTCQKMCPSLPSLTLCTQCTAAPQQNSLAALTHQG